ncbi:LysE family translocator [Shewanella sp. NIFS-20-20]|uniref:LysE family translocator n=1 Tax=Shewanella sp. NIFS-20-20 TaxID=2853806 RepID=UPI001C46E881|nr:LysE family translocator [Shewanella sp. NIFS-20-20]MBV7315862.1 LysE family translocator [Shewanella sp. NIFS-20-20]
MDISAILSLLAICFLGAMSPGPSLAMVVRHTLGSGRRHGIICAWAHACGIGIYALVTLLGLAAVLAQSPQLFTAISIIGAMYLAYLGIQALRSEAQNHSKWQAGTPTPGWQAARDGLAISLFNPKILLFFMALFSQFVLLAKELAGQALIVLTPMVIDGLWYTLVAVALSHPRVLDKLKAKAHIIDKLSGVVLLFLATRVIYSL